MSGKNSGGASLSAADAREHDAPAPAAPALNQGPSAGQGRPPAPGLGRRADSRASTARPRASNRAHRRSPAQVAKHQRAGTRRRLGAGRTSSAVWRIRRPEASASRPEAPAPRQTIWRSRPGCGRRASIRRWTLPIAAIIVASSISSSSPASAPGANSAGRLPGFRRMTAGSDQCASAAAVRVSEMTSVASPKTTRTSRRCPSGDARQRPVDSSR